MFKKSVIEYNIAQRDNFYQIRNIYYTSAFKNGTENLNIGLCLLLNAILPECQLMTFFVPQIICVWIHEPEGSKSFIMDMPETGQAVPQQSRVRVQHADG
jgi:hypothetical protein